MYILYICKYTSIDLDPKKIYSRANPDPKPPKIVDNLEKFLRKKSLTESQASDNPLPKLNYLPEILVTVEDLEFDLAFEHSLFHTKSDSFVP